MAKQIKMTHDDPAYREWMEKLLDLMETADGRMQRFKAAVLKNPGGLHPVMYSYFTTGLPIQMAAAGLLFVEEGDSLIDAIERVTQTTIRR
jgi:hypothetical protein